MDKRPQEHVHRDALQRMSITPTATAASATLGFSCSAPALEQAFHLVFKYPSISRNINHATAQGWTKCKRCSSPHVYGYIFTPHRSHLLKDGDGLGLLLPSSGAGHPPTHTAEGQSLSPDSHALTLQQVQFPPSAHLQVILS